MHPPPPPWRQQTLPDFASISIFYLSSSLPPSLSLPVDETKLGCNLSDDGSSVRLPSFLTFLTLHEVFDWRREKMKIQIFLMKNCEEKIAKTRHDLDISGICCTTGKRKGTQNRRKRSKTGKRKRFYRQVTTFPRTLWSSRQRCRLPPIFPFSTFSTRPSNRAQRSFPFATLQRCSRSIERFPLNR